MSVCIRDPGLAGFLHFEDFAVLIVSALGADVMGPLALVAVGALRKRAGGDGIVGAAKGGAPFGVAALWVRHGAIPFATDDVRAGALIFPLRGILAEPAAQV
jgi:hypothetical protein